jgi:hypothetical protein
LKIEMKFNVFNSIKISLHTSIMNTVKELGLEPTLKEAAEEALACSICCEELTVKNIVNPECGHATCKECFWRWAKDKNTCPFCRTNLLKNTQEAKDIQNMRELLEHRTQIVRQVEEAYEEKDALKARMVRIRDRLRNKTKEITEMATTLLEFRRAQGTYGAYRYWGKKVEAIQERDRHKREKIDEASMNLAHGDNGMCMEVLRDIKILGRAAGGPWEYGWFCKPKLDKVREMNRVRKERRKFREKGTSYFGSSGWWWCVRNLFQENEEDTDTDSMPELEGVSGDSGSDMDIDHTAGYYTSGYISTRGTIFRMDRASRRLTFDEVAENIATSSLGTDSIGIGQPIQYRNVITPSVPVSRRRNPLPPMLAAEEAYQALQRFRNVADNNGQ